VLFSRSSPSSSNYESDDINNSCSTCGQKHDNQRSQSATSVIINSASAGCCFRPLGLIALRCKCVCACAVCVCVCVCACVWCVCVCGQCVCVCVCLCTECVCVCLCTVCVCVCLCTVCVCVCVCVFVQCECVKQFVIMPFPNSYKYKIVMHVALDGYKI